MRAKQAFTVRSEDRDQAPGRVESSYFGSFWRRCMRTKCPAVADFHKFLGRKRHAGQTRHGAKRRLQMIAEGAAA